MSQSKRGAARPSKGSSTDAADDQSQDGPPPPPGGESETNESTSTSTASNGSASRKPRSNRKPRSGVTASSTQGDAAETPTHETSGDEPTSETSDDATADDRRKAPMTAADYARTTQGDPSSTSVMPAVRDDDSNPHGRHDVNSTSQPDDHADDSAPRQARLNLVHVDPWSVTKLAFVISVALMIVSVVAVTVFWIVLNVTGVWGSLNDTINSVLSSEDGTFDVTDYIGLPRILGLTLVLSAINVLLMTALAAIGARLYNVAAALVGGVQVTFADRA